MQGGNSSRTGKVSGCRCLAAEHVHALSGSLPAGGAALHLLWTRLVGLARGSRPFAALLQLQVSLGELPEAVAPPAGNLEGRQRRRWRARVVPGYRGAQKRPARRTVPLGGSKRGCSCVCGAHLRLAPCAAHGSGLLPAHKRGRVYKRGVCLWSERRWQLRASFQGATVQGLGWRPPTRNPEPHDAPLRAFCPPKCTINTSKESPRGPRCRKAPPCRRGAPPRLRRRAACMAAISSCSAKIATSLRFESPGIE